MLLELDMAAVTWMAASSLHAPCGSCRHDAAHKRAVATAGACGRGVEVCVGGNASPPLANSPATLLPALNLSKRVCAHARVQFVQTFPATSMVPSTPVPSHPDATSAPLHFGVLVRFGTACCTLIACCRVCVRRCKMQLCPCVFHCATKKYHMHFDCTIVLK